MSNQTYHGSTRLFDFFSLDNAGTSRGATNGALGIWVTPERHIASSFGGEAQGFLYTLAEVPGPIKNVPLSWLVEHHDIATEYEYLYGRDVAIGFYEHIRNTLLSEGYTQLWIIEENGLALTQVVLDPALIELIKVEHFSQNMAA